MKINPRESSCILMNRVRPHVKQDKIAYKIYTFANPVKIHPYASLKNLARESDMTSY